jgi:hypothetical protein
MTQEEKGETYALHKASEKLHDYYGSAMLNVVQFDGHDIQCAYVDGCLQTKQDLEAKKVDLENEINLWFDYGFPNNDELLDYIKETAKHFFELGLKAQKGE